MRVAADSYTTVEISAPTKPRTTLAVYTGDGVAFMLGAPTQVVAATPRLFIADIPQEAAVATGVPENNAAWDEKQIAEAIRAMKAVVTTGATFIFFVGFNQLACTILAMKASGCHHV